MDKGEEEAMHQGDSSSLMENVVVKQEPAWSMDEEPQDQPSAATGPARAMPDTASGSLPCLNRSHVCWHCPAAFVLVSSLELHLTACHGEHLLSAESTSSPVSTALHGSGAKKTGKVNKAPKRLSTETLEPVGNDSGDQAVDFVLKLEPPWSMKDDCQEQPPAVYRASRPVTYHTSSSLLSEALDRAHMCRCCSATFVLFSSLELHLASIHGATLHGVAPVAPSLRGREAGGSGKYSSMYRAKLMNIIGRQDEKRSEGIGDGNDSDQRDDERYTFRKYVCDLCSKAFTKRSNLKRHRLIHTRVSQRKWVCGVCSMTFTEVGNYKTHKLIHVGQKLFACDVCNKAFSRSNNLKSHKLIHTRQKQFICEICSRAFSRPDRLKTHQMVHNRRKQFVCEVCNEAFPKARNLRVHKLRHATPKSFVCEVCSKAFRTGYYLKKHKLTHSGEKPFVCDICNKGFTKACNLKVHQTIHTGERPFKCPLCETACNFSRDLQRHISSVHEGDRPYACDVCGAAFSTTGSLNRHKMVHTGEKPYTCEFCEAAFSLKGDMKRHQRVHTGEKPYVCPECGKGFAQSGGLKYHRLIHTGEKPHACLHCPAAFTRTGDLNRHVQKAHQ